MSRVVDFSNAEEVRREAQRRQMLRDGGARSFASPVSDAERAIEDAELGRLEKEIEHECDRLARALGFQVVRFSHPGKTKQTPGIPDRRYYHVARRVALWLEVKAPAGKQRPDQRLFQEMCESVGETYLLGGLGDFRRWLIAGGFDA